MDRAASSEADEGSERAPRLTLGSQRRRVLAAAGLLVLLGLAVQVVGPCLAPTRIVEGPMVQQPTETSAVVVWYTTREANCTFMYRDPSGSSHTASVETSGSRHVVRLA